MAAKNQDLDLFTKSEYVELITSMMEQDYGKIPIISRFHPVKTGDGNILFYLITAEGNRFIVDIMGKKVQDDALMYWIENINHAGLMHELFYERDLVVITFFRGEEHKNEYLSYFYVYGDRYPAIRFVPEEGYASYSSMLAKRYKKYDLSKLPEDLMNKPEK